LTYLATHPAEVFWLLVDHFAIVVGGLGLAALIAVPLGIVVHRVRALELPVMMVTGLLYITPSLALFGALIPLTGLGKTTAIAAQVVYSLLVIARNTAAGLRSASPSSLEAAKGLGLTRPQTLWLVELPAALAVIVGGLRVAAVMGVGIASIAAYVGAGGLGSLIFRGIATVDGDLIMAGVIPIIVLALSVDRSLRGVEARLAQ
jgi:osmoprotectant transport system permease protein